MPVPTSRPEEAINEQILRFFAAANVPFVASENVQFERLLQLLRPGTKPPSERSVGGKYLDSVYDQESTKLAERVRGRCVTLQVDGWSNLSGDPVIGIAFGFPGEVHLFKTVDTTGLPHTVENLENLILPAIDRLEESFSVRVVAVCTDGASNMAGLRDAIRAKKPQVSTYWCQAHVLNLLAQDLIKMHKDVFDKVVMVLKFLKDHHNAHAALKEQGIPLPDLPCLTRWSTANASLEYFNKFWGRLTEIIATLVPPKHHVRMAMENVLVRRATEDIICQQNPIALALARVHGDTWSLATAVEAWLALLQTFPAKFKDEKAKVVERSLHCMRDPLFLATFLLDHRHSGLGLSAEQLVSARTYLEDLSEDPASVALFLAREGAFAARLFELHVDPLTWWQAGLRSGSPPSLTNTAVRLLSCITSSAGLERQFSRLRLTYGLLRARLHPEKAGKLGFLAGILNSK